MNFGSDNQSGASAQVMDALVRANAGFAGSYGGDEHSKRAVDALREAFGCDLEAHFVVSGTAANCLALASLVRPWQTVICHALAHIGADESTAPEFFTGGARVLPIAQGTGKLTAAALAAHLEATPNVAPHSPQPGAVSIAQCNENGLVYSPVEVAHLASIAHDRGLPLHMDGARFANAVASLGCSPADVTWKAGVDVLSLGGTKGGCLAAEAVLFFNKAQAEHFSHLRKRAGHLLSKGRLFGAQFEAWLAEGHWLALAKHANKQARTLAEKLGALRGVRLAWPVDANELFVAMPHALAHRLQGAGAVFYDWNREALPPSFTLRPDESFVRLVTSHVTTDAEVRRFCQLAAAGA